MKKLICILLALMMTVSLLSAAVSAEEEIPVAQDVSPVLNATMTQLAATVTAPSFGTDAGEWTVFSLARGNHYEKGHAYFTEYYDRIVETVNTEAAAVNLNGALHKSKSTDNSRLIVALSAIGKDATAVGDWDLVEAYSANGMNWIRKQGLNGVIWALLALDSGNYETTDASIRQQCVDAILSSVHDDGGWSLVYSKAQPSNVDITGMTLTALYPYRDQPAVAAACETAIAWLSEVQLATGGFPYGNSETSESCVWAVVALSTWGINPDTDPRFIKEGKSAIDNLLSYYIADAAMFAHQGTEPNPMATDQACYALVAYDRLLKGQPALLDYSDVTFETRTYTATLGLPAQINAADSFNGIITVDQWDNSEDFKLLDFVMNIPEGISVTDVTPSSRLTGGQVSWHTQDGKLRVVYFDANENSSLTVTGEEFPAELFTVAFKAGNVAGGSKLELALTGMSLKRSSDSADSSSMLIIRTENAKESINVVQGLSFSAKCLYTGDDVDLIPSDKKAVAVAVTGITDGSKLTFSSGQYSVTLKYNAEISAKSGTATYVALVDASIDMEKFVNKRNYTISPAKAETVSFGDVNADGVVNAQDALAVTDTWLRKNDAPADDQILAMNVNGDSRINTFDALGIVEAFVNKATYIVVTKAATITE